MLLLAFGELLTLLKDGGAAVAAIGTLVWIVWHYHTRTIPIHQEQLQQLMSSHAEERVAITEQCKKERAELWEAFRKDMALERSIRLRELAALTGAKGGEGPQGPGNR